jgi:hypothetical protein
LQPLGHTVTTAQQAASSSEKERVSDHDVGAREDKEREREEMSEKDED